LESLKKRKIELSRAALICHIGFMSVLEMAFNGETFVFVIRISKIILNFHISDSGHPYQKTLVYTRPKAINGKHL